MKDGDELAIALAVTLIMVAIWPRFGRLTLLVPGVVLLWIVLPARAPFIVSDKRTRRDA